MLLKEHFLLAAEALKEQYPKSRFFAVVRQSLDRFRSGINLIKVISADGPHAKVWRLFPPSWKVIRNYVITTQIPYCVSRRCYFTKVIMRTDLLSHCHPC